MTPPLYPFPNVVMCRGPCFIQFAAAQDTPSHNDIASPSSSHVDVPTADSFKDGLADAVIAGTAAESLQVAQTQAPSEQGAAAESITEDATLAAAAISPTKSRSPPPTVSTETFKGARPCHKSPGKKCRPPPPPRRRPPPPPRRPPPPPPRRPPPPPPPPRAALILRQALAVLRPSAGDVRFSAWGTNTNPCGPPSLW